MTNELKTIPPHRVLIIEDHPVFREGLLSVLAREADFVVVGEASNGREGLAAIEQLHPDAVLLDLNLPDRAGSELVRDLRAMYPQLIILILTMADEALFSERLLRVGANGYVMKEEGPQKILVALRHVLQGQIYISENMAAHILNSFAGAAKKKASPLANLSDREFEIFQLIGRGQEKQEIARQLSISVKTVDAHRGHIKEKLKIGSVTELLCYAVRWMESQERKPSPAPRTDSP